MTFPCGKILGIVAVGLFTVSMTIPASAGHDSARVETLSSARHAKTAALKTYVPYSHAKANAPIRVFPIRKPNSGGSGGTGGTTGWTDPAKQTSYTTPLAATPGANFSAISGDGYVPPDPNLSVGTTQVVAIANVEFAVYDKSGHTIEAAAPIHAIFHALGSSDLCATTDGGDPIVLFDKVDQRWLITQLAYNNSLSDNHVCIAISDSDDATGAYDVYDEDFGSNFPDYPKYGVWSDGGAQAGVYFSANIFASGNSFIGAEFCAFSLADMANPPASLQWVCDGPDANAYNVLPADQEGGTAGETAAGAPELYLQFADNLSKTSGNALSLYKYYVDFAAPGNSALEGPSTISVDTFHEACGGSSCIPQLNTREKLDSLGDRLMYRLSFRHYSTGNESLVVNHSVQISSSTAQTGIRWYEIADPNGTPRVVQDSTYAPDSGNYRWMGSVGQDKVGDLGLGYSRSSSRAYVGVVFTGQKAGDPANQMETESVLTAGKGAQTSVNRWGDYSAISLDPSDDCTFWYTNEILTTTGSYYNWQTVIGNFKFPSCR